MSLGPSSRKPTQAGMHPQPRYPLLVPGFLDLDCFVLVICFHLGSHEQPVVMEHARNTSTQEPTVCNAHSKAAEVSRVPKATPPWITSCGPLNLFKPLPHSQGRS